MYDPFSKMRTERNDTKTIGIKQKKKLKIQPAKKNCMRKEKGKTKSPKEKY